LRDPNKNCKILQRGVFRLTKAFIAVKQRVLF